jgi:hypothetical protein
MIQPVALLAACAMMTVAGQSWAAQITADRNEQGVVIKIDGQPFTQYWIKAGNKPVVWPIVGPTGQPMTRAYPMGKGENEKEDHPHQRSLWFTHGDLNGTSFWDEPASYAKGKPKHAIGEIKHREFVEVHGGPEAVIVTRNDWLGQDGRKICGDLRRLTFGVDGTTRRIDFDIKLTADPAPVTFGDTKEGSFGVRVAETMKVDAKLGGQIVNNEGLKDKDAWGKRAAWVDYHGPVAGQKVGIAILNHPSSFRYPTYWHVRTYGLYAANVFGVNGFTGKKEDNGAYKLERGKSIEFHYRVLFHKGDEKEGRVAEAFAAYAKEGR